MWMKSLDMKGMQGPPRDPWMKECANSKHTIKDSTNHLPDKTASDKRHAKTTQKTYNTDLISQCLQASAQAFDIM
jgi:hypothetical protein